MTNQTRLTGMQWNTIGLDIIPVTPNDSTDLAKVGVLYIETGGDIVVRTFDGGDTNRTITVASASWFPIVVRRVLSTGTTASGIHVVVGD